MAYNNRPWDQRANILGRNQSSTPLLQSSPTANSISGGGGRPRLPPKQDVATMYRGNNYSGYNNSLNSFGYGGIGNSYMPTSYGHGGYGSYGNYGSCGPGSSYGMYGNRPPSYENNYSFVQEAEESSREAFDSIASIVRAFSSVTMMLESTFQAVYSSFNAVLSVADHFSQLKSHFGQIFSILAMIRTVKWIHRKLFYLLGLSKVDPSTEAVWAEAKSGSLLQSSEIVSTGRSMWPIIVFLSALYVAPYLIWRCLSSLMSKTSTDLDWVTAENETDTVGVCIFDYQAQSNDELTISCGEIVTLAPKHLQKDSNWPLVCLCGRKGKVPINYFNIRPRGQTSGSNNPAHTTLNMNASPLRSEAEVHKPTESIRRKDVLMSHQRGPNLHNLPANKDDLVSKNKTNFETEYLDTQTNSSHVENTEGEGDIKKDNATNSVSQILKADNDNLSTKVDLKLDSNMTS